MLELKKHHGHEECTAALRQALELLDSDLSDEEAIATLGQGWVGDEALAITVYCALRYQDDFRQALIAAVNHDGDSDSTGAITGNILGAYLGLQQVPSQWVEKIEPLPVITTIADDLLHAQCENRVNWVRYPGY